jgi:phage terminase large subunit-like protein
LDLSSLSPEALQALITDGQRRISETKLVDYRAYKKQREFHDAGREHPERLLMAANRVGKTYCGAAEVAIHLTGRYPNWWRGREFKKPNRWWAASETTEMTVAGVQANLAGRVEDGIGNGMVPKDAIVEDKKKSHGFPGALEFMIVRHGGGGDVQAGRSYLGFKSYDQGREKFQAETLDGVWLDEEPKSDLYFEALTRISTTGGMVFMTFTPLKGPTDVVIRFMQDKPAGTKIINMTIEDAEHISPEDREMIIARYPEHELEARVKGVPALGEGRVFPVTEKSITCKRFTPPSHFWRIGGIDFGWKPHPSAAIELLWDRDHDVFYVSRAWRETEKTPVMMAAALRSWGVPWMPWAWPHDAMQERQDNSGYNLAQQMRDQGLFMLPEHAQYVDGTNGREAGVRQMLDLMYSGRWYVFDDLTDWFEEFRFYHRKEGKIVALLDDLLSATRYAYMMRRFAGQAPNYRAHRRYGRVGSWRVL